MNQFSKYQRSHLNGSSESSDESSESENESSEDDDDDFDDFMEKAVEELEEGVEEKGSYDEKFITKLVKNYRSHPDILEVIAWQNNLKLFLLITNSNRYPRRANKLHSNQLNVLLFRPFLLLDVLSRYVHPAR